MAKDESLTSSMWEVPPRGQGPMSGSGSSVTRPVLRTIYSRPVSPGRFVETPGMGMRGARPSAWQASGRGSMPSANLSPLASAMANVIYRAMQANKLL